MHEGFRRGSYRAPVPDPVLDLRVLTWLASYPRSGNTLLRIVLQNCFGLTSQSLYNDGEFSDSPLQAIVGEEPVGSDPRGFLDDAARNGRTLYVKNHELPGQDDHPAIYVVRDGRSAVVSHHHYLREIAGLQPSLGDVIAGRHGASWSRHVRAWVLSGRPNTLVVRYESLARGDAQTLQAISRFIDRPQLSPFDVSFTALNRLDKAFFRRGSDQANIAEMDDVAVRLFERLHGETLRAIGYGVGAVKAPSHHEMEASAAGC